MKYKRGSTVEVFCYQSWRCARIVSGKGHNYTVSYDVYPGFTSKDDVERVSVKAIRPSPPQLQVSECWVPGDVAEVFHNLSWKMVIVLKDLGWDQFVVRLVGSLHEFKVIKSELRVRQSFQDGEWIVIGKVPSDYKDAQNNLKRASPEKVDVVANKKTCVNRTNGCESSSDSCSINSYKAYETCHGYGFVEDHESDAESVCPFGYHEESQSQETDESFANDEIHRMELNAYCYTMVALHASGPLTWEKESMVTNLRISLHISNDEHLIMLKNLISTSSKTTSR